MNSTIKNASVAVGGVVLGALLTWGFTPEKKPQVEVKVVTKTVVKEVIVTKEVVAQKFRVSVVDDNLKVLATYKNIQSLELNIISATLVTAKGKRVEVEGNIVIEPSK